MVLDGDEQLFRIGLQALPDVAGYIDLDLVIRASAGIDQAHKAFGMFRPPRQT